MPEMPEVRVVSSKLNKEVSNKTIADVLVFLPKLIKNATAKEFKETLKGKKILSVTNRGKFIIFKLSDGYYLVSHLRMEGKYRTHDDEDKHNHIIFVFKDKTKLIYNDSRQFGTLHLFDHDPNNEEPLAKLANEPQDIDVDALFEKLKRKTIPIKAALLDQSLVLGLGNIYVNEVLYEAKINPLRAANAISKVELKKLLKISAKIMDKSTELGGTTIDSYESLNKEEGQFQNFLKVHMKDKELCKNCKTPIKKIKVGGRGTYFCPTCQKD